MTQDDRTKTPSWVYVCALIFLVGTGLFGAFHYLVLPEARLPVKPSSVHFILNQTNYWTAHKEVEITYQNPLVTDFNTAVSVNVPDTLEKTDIIENMLSANISAKDIDPRRVDISVDASMLGMQSKRATYYGSVVILDINNNNKTVAVIDVTIDITPLPNYGITLTPANIHLSLNKTGNWTDHKLISIENPLQKKLDYQIKAINASLQSNFMQALNVTIYPEEYSQRISIDAHNNTDDSPLPVFDGGNRDYYGYIDILLEDEIFLEADRRTVGVIDLKISVSRE